MKKYQIVEVAEQFHFAGTKATADFAQIAKELGYEQVFIRMNSTKHSKLAKVKRQIGYYFDWKKSLKTIEPDSVVLLQHPFHYPQLTREKSLLHLKEKKNIKFISVVHDVEELRIFRFNEYYQKEFDFMVQNADAIIVHNEVMLQFFVEKGVAKERLVNLEIFDYLQNNSNDKLPAYEQSITIAGNLDINKCAYIADLNKLEPLKVHLYGASLDDKVKQYSNVMYHGSVAPDELPMKLTTGFGLVWDGESIADCQGDFGQYLKYNNPHKLSLYLSSGLPVVIWAHAAEADFVRNNGVGICVESLEELPDILKSVNEDTYAGYANAVKEISGKLRDGLYAQKAILEAEVILKESVRG